MANKNEGESINGSNNILQEIGLSQRKQGDRRAPLAWADRIAVLVVVVSGMLSFIGLLVVVAWNIIMRELQFSQVELPTDLVELLFSWMIFLWAVILTRNREHITVPLLEQVLKGRVAVAIYRVFVDTLVLIFVALFFYSSKSLLAGATSRTSPMLHWPQDMWYSSLIVSSGLMVIYVLSDLVRSVISSARSPK